MASPEENRCVRVVLNDTSVAGLKQRQPTLFIEPGRRLFCEPTLFLHRHYVQSGVRSSPETWEAAAYALQSWFDFVWATGMADWHDADREKLIEYRDAYSQAISPKTGAVYASGTIGNRMSIILAFYRYAGERGLYDGDLVSIALEERARVMNPDDDALAHTRRGMRS